jgi:hypothetical protein
MSNLRKLTASEGMVYTDLKTETMRAKFLYLGIGDSEENYKQIPEDTPLPETDVENDEATKEDLYNALAELGVE